MSSPDLSQKAAGLIIGLAAGDKNRGPFQMSHKLLESILDSEHSYKPTDVFRRYLLWYFNKETGWYDTGPTAAAVFKQFAKKYPDWRNEGTPAFDSVENILEISRGLDANCGGLTGGVNAAHRAAPLALIPFLIGGQMAKDASLENLVRIAETESKLTHWCAESRGIEFMLLS